MSLLRRLFTARPQTSRQSSGSSDLTPTRLPDGSEHDPIWNPLDDDKMAQGMNLKQPDFGTHTSSVVRRGEVTLRVPGLFAEDDSLRENPTEQAVDIIETVSKYMHATGRRRSPNEIALRLSALLAVYGESNDGFRRFQMDVEKEVKQLNSTRMEMNENPKLAGPTSSPLLNMLWQSVASPRRSLSSNEEQSPPLNMCEEATSKRICATPTDATGQEANIQSRGSTSAHFASSHSFGSRGAPSEASHGAPSSATPYATGETGLNSNKTPVANRPRAERSSLSCGVRGVTDQVCATGDGSAGLWHTANSMSLRSLSNKRGQELPSNGTIPASLPSSVCRKRPADLISSTPSRRISSRLSASSSQLTSRAREQFRLTRETPDAAARKTTSSYPSKSSLMRATPNAATRKPHTCHRAESSHSPSKSSRSPHPSRSSVGATSTRQAQEAMDLADMVPSLLGQPSRKSQRICSSSEKLPIESALSELDPMELLDYFSDNHSVEGGSADASEGRADAQMDEPPSLNDVSDEVVRWGRSSVLKQLNLPAASSRLFDGVHQETRGDILRHLRRTTEGVENVSALILGPKGAGYIRKVLLSLHQHDDIVLSSSHHLTKSALH